MLDATRSHWVNLQQVLLRSGPGALRGMGYEFSPIDNNPRHGILLLTTKETQRKDVVAEVVERCGLWWVVPKRPFRFV